MKNTLLILLLILALVGCKDDEEPEPDVGVVYEEWTKVSSDVVNLNSRWVLKLEAHDTNLYVQCLKSYYKLNQDLGREKHYLKGFNYEPWARKGPQIGRNYSLHRHTTATYSSVRFNLMRTSDPFDDVWISYDSILGGRAGALHSNIDDEGNFCILYSKAVGDSLDLWVDIYKWAGNWQKPERQNKLFLARTHSTEGIISDVSLINNVFYVSAYRNLYVLENDEVAHKIPFNIRHIHKYNDALVGVADNIWRGMPDEPQLMISYDDGKSWSSVMKGRTLNSGNLKVVGEEILLIRGWYVLILDIENGEFKEVNMDGTDAYFSDVTKLGDKAILGTESGVYYKSWESFLNK
jgi:hypothetical protein